MKLTFPDYQAGWVHYDICARLEAFSHAVERRESPRLMLLMPPRHGKMLAHETEVYARVGGRDAKPQWTTHGALRPGDYVLNRKFAWQQVVNIGGDGYVDYEVTTISDVTILAHGNHDWTVDYRRIRDKTSGHNGPIYYREVVSTKEMYEVLEKKKLSSNPNRRHQLYQATFNLPPLDLLHMNTHRDRLYQMIAMRKRPVGATGIDGIREIRKLEPSERKPGRCIQVDGDEGVYLVTRSFIPTHNSELASIRLPAWHLGRCPQHEIINAGYNTDLPMKFSRAVRSLFRGKDFNAIFPDAQIDEESQAAESWRTTRNGGFKAAGVGGGISGFGAHILAIDDPLKNMEEADSPERRELLWDWYMSTAYTRLAPGGGVLVIQCMTGDTPVLMPDGLTKRLDQVRVHDRIATYKNGELGTSFVVAQRSVGLDDVFKITMRSGRTVRANARHPFLVQTTEGLKWIRTRSLSTGRKIVALADNGVSGKVSYAPQTDAANLPNVADTALRTTTESVGQMDIDQHPSIQSTSASGISNIDTDCRPKNIREWLKRKVASARYAVKRLMKKLLRIGPTDCASIMITKPEKFADYSATRVTLPLDSFEPSVWHSDFSNTSEFTLDEIVSIEPDFYKSEVFDLQVAFTENFIANGLVSHNTCWNDDDLAGRLQNSMLNDPDADQFEVVKYPALSDFYEYRDEVTRKIVRAKEPISPAPNTELTLLREPDVALHLERYDTKAIKKIRAIQPPRIWSALYQQNPVPDDGSYFRKGDFRFLEIPPDIFKRRVISAWDFAVGDKQQHDWTVGVTIMQDERGNLTVLDVYRGKLTSDKVISGMLEVALKYGTHAGDYTIVVEDGVIWKSMAPAYRSKADQLNARWTVVPQQPLTNKLARARPLQGLMEMHKIWFLVHAPWYKELYNEMIRFPAGKNDDQVDALSWATRVMIETAPMKDPVPPAPPSWKDKIDVPSTGGSHMSA